jgi:F1F0 ATPase subunit 2
MQMEANGLELALGIFIALVVGAAIGAAHFGGLWLTLRALSDAKRPALLGMVSFLGRLVITAGGFVALAYFGEWYHVVLALAAAIAVRSLLQQRINRGADREPDA